MRVPISLHPSQQWHFIFLKFSANVISEHHSHCIKLGTTIALLFLYTWTFRTTYEKVLPVFMYHDSAIPGAAGHVDLAQRSCRALGRLLRAVGSRLATERRGRPHEGPSAGLHLPTCKGER